jgi:predicted nucleic acid-binding protein
MRTMGGYFIPSPTMLMAAVIIALCISNVILHQLYRSAVDDLSTFKSAVEAQSELLRIENAEKLQASLDVNRQINADYAKARAALAGRPRVVRVRDTCSGTGILPTVSSNAGLTAQLPVEEPFAGAERVITVEECETRLGYAIEDAVTIEWMKSWAQQQHEASK